jgi:predicted RNase H-like HicB family nuclease
LIKGKKMSVQQCEFFVVIRQDEDGGYIGEVPQLGDCYGQGRTVEELMVSVREAIAQSLEQETVTPAKMRVNGTAYAVNGHGP